MHTWVYIKMSGFTIDWLSSRTVMPCWLDVTLINYLPTPGSKVRPSQPPEYSITNRTRVRSIPLFVGIEIRHSQIVLCRTEPRLPAMSTTGAVDQTQITILLGVSTALTCITSKNTLDVSSSLYLKLILSTNSYLGHPASLDSIFPPEEGRYGRLHGHRRSGISNSSALKSTHTNNRKIFTIGYLAVLYLGKENGMGSPMGVLTLDEMETLLKVGSIQLMDVLNHDTNGKVR